MWRCASIVFEIESDGAIDDESTDLSTESILLLLFIFSFDVMTPGKKFRFMRTESRQDE